MASPYVGQITAFGFPFAPRYWAFCDGATVPMNQYGALYALIGNTFGGDGRSTIGLPDLGGASPCGTGAGPGLTQRSLGRAFGTAAVTLDGTTMPPHSHIAQAVPLSRGSSPSPSPSIQSGLSGSTAEIYGDGAATFAMAAGAITPAGLGTAHNNMQPYIALNYCIALMGEYPQFD